MRDVRTVGVEEELLLVSPGGVALPIGEGVVNAAPADELEHEFKLEQTETASDPLISLDDLREQLRSSRRAADDAARQVGGRAVAIGTSPMWARAHQTPDDRYLSMSDEFGQIATQQLTCGQHVHVAVDSRAEGVGVLDRIRDWLPLIRAISANSPFWQGTDTGHASYRSVLWGQWPTAGTTELFGDETGYARVVNDLIAAGAALDVGMIYFDARLSESYPTVEIRVADVCTDLDDAVLLAALCRGLVETAAEAWRQGVAPLGSRPEVLRAANWRAARHGLAGKLVNPLTAKLADPWSAVAGLVRHVAPALRRADDEGIAASGLARLRQQGGGADRQRSTWQATSDLRAVVTAAAERTLAG